MRPKPASAQDDVAMLDPTQGSRTAAAKSPLHEQIAKLCRDVLAPLVRADEGILYLVSATAEDVHIHLGGACAGCPGAAITRERMFTPAINGIAPKATVRVTTGFRVPEGADRID